MYSYIICIIHKFGYPRYFISIKFIPCDRNVIFIHKNDAYSIYSGIIVND